MTLFTDLETEWRVLGASPPAIAALRTWARRDRVLEPFGDLHAVVRFAQRSGDRSRAEQVLACVAAAYERICTYPIDRRPRSIAPNILLDTRQGVSRALFRPRVVEDGYAEIERLAVAAAESSAADELVGLVDEAVRARKLRVDDARLIVLTRVAGMTTAELAAEGGCAVQTLRRRRQRAEAVLAAAVRCVA